MGLHPTLTSEDARKCQSEEASPSISPILHRCNLAQTHFTAGAEADAPEEEGKSPVFENDVCPNHHEKVLQEGHFGQRAHSNGALNEQDPRDGVVKCHC